MKFRIGDKVRLPYNPNAVLPIAFGIVENSDHLTGKIRVRWSKDWVTEWWPESAWEFAEKPGGRS